MGARRGWIEATRGLQRVILSHRSNCISCPEINEINPCRDVTYLVDIYIQGEDYVLVLQMEIIELLIFGEKYKKIDSIISTSLKNT